MADPIEAHYTPDGDDWTIAVKGRGKTLTGRAPGLIAARDRADQLVEQLAPEESGRRTVVHLLNGNAVEFTEAYLTARLAREPAEPLSEPAPTEAKAIGAVRPPGEAKPTDTAKPADTAKQDEPKAKDEGQEVPAPATSVEAPKPAPPKPTPAPRAASHTGGSHAAPAEEAAPSTP